MLLRKTVSENKKNSIAKALPFKWEMIWNNLQTTIVSKKREATLCFQNKNKFQNLLIWNLPKEKCFDLENKSFQRILFPKKLARISTCFSKVLQLTLPHHSNRISRTACHEKFWKNPRYLQKRFHQNDFKFRVLAISKRLFQKAVWESI